MGEGGYAIITSTAPTACATTKTTVGSMSNFNDGNNNNNRSPQVFSHYIGQGHVLHLKLHCRDTARPLHCRLSVRKLGLGFDVVWGLGFGVWGLGFGVWGSNHKLASGRPAVLMQNGADRRDVLCCLAIGLCVLGRLQLQVDERGV